jgi:predicted metal-dependent HD superfamily phosphohydrolase
VKKVFLELTASYSSDSDLSLKLWSEIETNYSDKKRHYHNLQHLRSLYLELESVADKLNDRDTLLFSLFYHDIVYKISKKDNEERSAELAADRLSELGFPAHRAQLYLDQIIATKSHEESVDSDTNFFTDADLAILGKGWNVYETYIAAIRKEYGLYPDLLYKPGRRKVLQHLLSLDRLFKSDEFYERYEDQARRNILRELELL